MKIIIISAFAILLASVVAIAKSKNFAQISTSSFSTANINPTTIPTPPYPLSIEALRRGKYPGSKLVTEEVLTNGSNYTRSIVSYISEGNKIFALLTVPTGQPPVGGWPVIIFNHGYIPPLEYRTTERYIAYVDGFATNGYVVLRSDYRGHGESEGTALGGYGNNDYTIDILNAVSSIKKQGDINPNKIGMWGHSMGGHITLRNMVASQDVKAGVIWAGVVASYQDLLTSWRRSPALTHFPTSPTSWRSRLTKEFGTFEDNPRFWNSISATSYLSDISGPVQLHHGTADDSVPSAFSVTLDSKMKSADKISELYIYEGDDHNLAQNFNTAMQRSVEFFDKYLKE